MDRGVLQLNPLPSEVFPVDHCEANYISMLFYSRLF